MYILLADTEDWGSFGEDVEGYLEEVAHRILSFLPQTEKDMFANNVRRWSQIARPSYMQFRQVVKDIAFKNHARLGIPKEHSRFHNKMTRDQIAFITDDDDWFNPEVVPTVAAVFEEHPEVEAVHWDTWQYDVSNFRENFHTYNMSRVGSNGFAIRGGNSPWLYTWGAHRKVETWLPPEKKFYLPYKALSVWNIHPGSFWQRTHFPLADGFHKVERSPRPAILDWAAEEIEAMYALLKSFLSKTSA